MSGIWLALKVEWLVVFAVYLFIQILALRRLEGDRKRRGQNVLRVMVIIMMVPSSIHLVFENAKASGIARLLVGVCASFAMYFLLRMLAEQKSEKGGFSHRI
jgi:uncharacterized membrane-anchored protein